MNNLKDNKIRIMHAIIGSGFGGLEKVAMNIINGLDRDIYERYLLCISSPTLLGDEYKDSSAKLITLNYGRGKHFSLPFKIQEIVKKNKINILHMHDFNPYFYCTLGTILNKSVKRVYTEHSGIYTCKKRHIKCIKMLYGFTDALVMVSGDLKKYYEDKIGINGKKLHVIYNGIHFEQPSDSFDPENIKKNIGIEKGDLIIGTACRLIEQKGLKYLINAAPMIVKEFPSVKFLIVGDGRLKETLESMVRDMKLVNYFRFLGYRKDVNELLNIFDVYTLPSLWEGLPLGVLEAMFCKKAIVASRVGGVPELIEDHATGILVDPDDSKQLGHMIVKLLKDENLRKILGQRAFEYCQHNFTIEKMINEYDGVYKNLFWGKLAGRKGLE